MILDPSPEACPYLPACVLRASGPDAPAFLQGQFSNDLAAAPPGETVYGLWLDRKGHVLADSHVVSLGKDYLIASVASPAGVIRGLLEAHIIADDVCVADETPEWSGAAVVGPGSGAWLAAAPRPGVRFRGRRVPGESWEWLFPASAAAAARGALAALPAVAPGDLERRRIAAGIPAVPADIGPSDLPNEGGLEREAISYSKGCYTGQEVMARLKSLGRVRRRLVRVRGPGAAPATPAALWSGGRRLGEVRSAVAVDGGFEGLALLPALPAGAGLALSEGGEPALAVVAGP